jgi:hypothetical protein
VVYILGSRGTSPFKTLNIKQAVKPFSRCRTTRASKKKEDKVWVPTIQEFMECKTVEGFKNLQSAEEDFPAINLWAHTQTFWIHPKIFEVLDTNRPQGARKLAIKIMTALDSEVLDQAPPEQTHHHHALLVGHQKSPRNESLPNRRPNLQALWQQGPGYDGEAQSQKDPKQRS